MAVKSVDAGTLLASNWEELQTELVEWDDCDEDEKGFTEDLELTGFESELGFSPSPDWERRLADTIKWQKEHRLL
ncbi:MAG: hypothetical protein ABGY96_22705 [bacterium]|nr:hypothetical protein [Gammaproteobacteria bacterium]HIL97003.1 hypothetical protein [Pseudomonadales bacterium]